jgi:hypothetical protein
VVPTSPVHGRNVHIESLYLFLAKNAKRDAKREIAIFLIVDCY